MILASQPRTTTNMAKLMATVAELAALTLQAITLPRTAVSNIDHRSAATRKIILTIPIPIIMVAVGCAVASRSVERIAEVKV